MSRTHAVLWVVVGLAAAGALCGAVWAWLAPPIHGVVALTRSNERVKAYLGNEADHFFTAAALLVGLLAVLVVVAAVAVWQWRRHRGPVMMAALCLGSVAASAAAVGVGAALVRWRYGHIDVATVPVSEQNRVHYVTEAPAVFFGHTPLQVALTLLFPAAVAAIVYVLAAVSTSRDDLGGWPPVEPAAPVTGRTVTEVDAPPVAPSSPSP
ncbi:MAG: DUF2567 domain-containing protein [Mycolicibacterium rufum]|uniref:DUF2567 domain-containing protein n=1 Tax=Mycolicibacterium chlorophenolicum TaxID=37916 RepID=A0A0J6W3S9_9MYCO|nr:DUF2567 domain-containing protein [Mycolicibacterium chlorophenolicum]KMO77960.1 hypothetical protein MCHLDSM_01871 [Mycolicibacterium chlorophenolicum]MBI5336817.1 DUF2567 domain-containing protein [Mycolicibacterium rufum]